nr:MAG TPA: coat protein [Caudoviricetes sp.]
MGRWRWGFTDSYSRRFQTANPYFSDSTPAGTE